MKASEQLVLSRNFFVIVLWSHDNSYTKQAVIKEPAFVPGWLRGFIIKIDCFHFNLYVCAYALFDGDGFTPVDYPLGKLTSQSSLAATVSLLEKKG